MIDLTKIEFWDCDDESEYLNNGSIHEAVEMYVDDIPPENPITDDMEVEVHGFVRETISERWRKNGASVVVDRILEYLDEEYGSPDDATTVTKEMLAAAEEFIEKFLAGYKVWRCKKVVTRKVRVRDYYEGE